MHLDDALNDTNSEKPSNKIYDTDVNRTVQYTRWLLDILGVWALISRNSSRTEKCVSKILIIFCPIVLLFAVIPAIVHIILREKDPMIRIMLFGPIGFYLTNFLKLSFIVLRYKTIKFCIEHVETDWMSIENENDRAIMMRYTRAGRGLTVMCGAFMYTGGMTYHIAMPLWSGNTINELNETVRPLAFPGFDIFVDPYRSPTYELIYCIISISGFVCYTVATAACNIAATFVTHACGQIQIVMSRLAILIDDTDEDRNSLKLQQRISFIIQCHVRVFRFTSSIEEILREVCFVEVIASTLIICLLEYYCMTEWSNSETLAIITYFVLLISLSLNIFIFCHIGELLNEQSHQVAKATYMVEWYRLPGKTGRALVMIIAMANLPRKLTAGRMMELSIRSFADIIKSSVVYLNMLRTVAT